MSTYNLRKLVSRRGRSLAPIRQIDWNLQVNHVLAENCCICGVVTRGNAVAFTSEGKRAVFCGVHIKKAAPAPARSVADNPLFEGRVAYGPFLPPRCYRP